MIINCKIINQPDSGEFEERIYDIQSPWNSQSWAYIKFQNEDFSEWCGVFRGNPIKAEISKKKDEILVLTRDYLWKIDAKNGDVQEYEDQPQYSELTVAPNGDFIIADYYTISRIKGKLKDAKDLISPIKMDMIKFKNWESEILKIECVEFLNWDRQVILELDSSKWTIKIKT
ncbi:MAG: hypothetical protein ACWA5P_10910 [bacterium]